MSKGPENMSENQESGQQASNPTSETEIAQRADMFNKMPKVGGVAGEQTRRATEIKPISGASGEEESPRSPKDILRDIDASIKENKGVDIVLDDVIQLSKSMDLEANKPYLDFLKGKLADPSLAALPEVLVRRIQEAAFVVTPDFKNISSNMKLAELLGIDKNKDLGPELKNIKEWETSPERGRLLVDEIVLLRTTMSYEERYALRDEEGRPYLTELYKGLQEYVDAICRQRNEKNPWDRYIRDSDGNVTGVKDIEETPLLISFDDEGVPHLEKVPQTGQQPKGGPEKKVTDEERTSIHDSLKELLAKDKDRATPAAERPEIQRQLLIYFRIAQEKGLLQGVDQVLASIYNEIKGTPSNQTRRLIAQRISEAEEAAELTFDTKNTDPEVVALDGVWTAYIRMARQRFELALQGQKQPDHREGEFKLPQEQEDESTEIYWEVGSYPKYYHITARTPEQFLTAKTSFLQMIRAGYLGKSPEAIYEHVNNFIAVFGSEGSRQVKKGNLSGDFLKEQRQELEAQLYVFGADYSNETYNPKSFKEFMTAMALHEGPARWTRLLRAGDGQVGVFTHIFDKEAVMEVFNNPVGERGELDIIAQHYLQDQVREMVIERGMGIVLKDYDPNNPENPIRFINDENSKAVRAQEFKDNLERIGLHMPDKELKSLFEGFDSGDAHMQNFINLRQLSEDQLKQLPKNLRDSVELGRIQIELQAIRDKIQSGEIKLKKRGDTAVDLLSSKDRKVYKEFYSKAEANFDIAFQMQGASGEKVRRGRGFFYVDRNTHVQGYKEAEERSRKIGWILGELEKYRDSGGGKGKKLEDFSEDIQAFYKNLTNQEKTKNPQGLYGIDNSKVSEAQQRSLRIGKILDDLRENVEFNALSLADRVFYLGLSDEGRKVDQNLEKLSNQDKQGCINVFQRLRNTNDEKLSQEERILKRAGRILSEIATGRALTAFNEEDQRFYRGLSEEDRNDYVDQMPIYLAEKFVQYAVTRTKVQYANFKAKVRTAAVAEARRYAIERIKKYGLQATLELPEIVFNEMGDVVGWDENIKKPVGFQDAVKYIYSRYTTHTYWGYQGENRDMVLKDELLEAAKRIRAGISRPEDEDVLATQFLIIDPTLKRVKKFPKNRGREVTLFQAAVEESFLSHVSVNKDLFKAFLPKDGNWGKMRAGYNMEDWGGTMRFAMGIKELSAFQPARFTRRLGAEIAVMPIYIDSMAAIWGQDGVMGAVSMFADKIKDIGHQGIVSQFGITKFIDQIDAAVQLYNALIGFVHEGKHVEGLYMKPTNNNEFLNEFAGLETLLNEEPKREFEFLKALKETFGRLEAVLKIMRTMYSDTRNAGGALRLENVDIFLDDGRYNPAIENDPDIHMNTGTSRHLENDFYDEFTKWLISEELGGGGQIYPGEFYWNKFILKKLMIYEGRLKEITKTFKDWFFDKAGL